MNKSKTEIQHEFAILTEYPGVVVVIVLSSLDEDKGKDNEVRIKCSCWHCCYGIVE